MGGGGGMRWRVQVGPHRSQRRSVAAEKTGLHGAGNKHTGGGLKEASAGEAPHPPEEQMMGPCPKAASVPETSAEAWTCRHRDQDGQEGRCVGHSPSMRGACY